MTTRIAIAGAGIGGLVAAIAISRALESVEDVQVDVYERSATLGEVGAGIGVWPRVWAILKELGITDDLLKHYDGRIDQAFEYWRDGSYLFKLDDMDILAGGPTRTFHRADFQNVLLAHIPKDRCHIHTGKRLVRYEKDSASVTLSFADNSTAQCDILVGADGVYSAVRKTMLAGKKGADPVYSGMTAYRSVIDPARMPAEHYMLQRRVIAIGNSTMVISYPIMHDNEKALNSIVFIARHDLEGSAVEGPMGAPVADVQEIKDSLRTDLHEDTKTLINAIDKSMRWSVPIVGPLDSWAEQTEDARICVLGDAAHAMTPFQASGTGQAIEDAWVLSKVLAEALSYSSDPSKKLAHVGTAMRAYDKVRRPIAIEVQDRSRRAGRVVTMADIAADEPPESLKQMTLEIWSWAAKSLPSEQAKNATELFREQAASAQ